MYNSNIPTDTEVPSTAKLIKSTIIAAITAGILLVTVVMPSEYGIDPTGIGNAIGLKRMGEIKTSLVEEAAADAAMDKGAIPIVKAETKPEPIAVSTQSDAVKITLDPDKSTEIKVTMKEAGKVNYSWDAGGSGIFFDVHGDSKALEINYHKYEKGTADKKSGTLEAAFDGNHGWYFKNRNAEPVTFTLEIDGEYSAVKRY